jgi:hypothetical protein
MINFTLNGERDCPSLCIQTQLELTTKDLGAPIEIPKAEPPPPAEAPPWVDHDNDGWYVPSDKTKYEGNVGDCDDDDPAVHPGAAEPFCADRDLDCDGKKPAQASKLSDLDPAQWNAFCSVCKDGPVKPAAKEVENNPYDDDCDGAFAYDEDGDGIVSGPGPMDDCDDYDSSIHPGASEVAGNFADEDCDGYAVDADGDGMPASGQAFLADKVGIDVSLFVDCDDSDTAVNPKMHAADEAGQLGVFYYRVKGSSELHRRQEWCDAFTEAGQPTALFHQLVKDLNCDYRVTDADGDGYTARGDLSLGKEHEGDCDDYDPRIVPKVQVTSSDPDDAGTSDAAVMTSVMCMPRGDLMNDSTCEVQVEPYVPSETCPVVGTRDKSIVTSCIEARDASDAGTGMGVCAFIGWQYVNPPSPNAGRIWGPCDGQESDTTKQLKSCPAGTVCAGATPSQVDKPWTKQFEDAVVKGYKVSKPLAFHGTCFPGCIIQKKN